MLDRWPRFIGGLILLGGGLSAVEPDDEAAVLVAVQPSENSHDVPDWAPGAFVGDCVAAGQPLGSELDVAVGPDAAVGPDVGLGARWRYWYSLCLKCLPGPGGLVPVGPLPGGIAFVAV